MQRHAHSGGSLVAVLCSVQFGINRADMSQVSDQGSVPCNTHIIRCIYAIIRAMEGPPQKARLHSVLKTSSITHTKAQRSKTLNKLSDWITSVSCEKNNPAHKTCSSIFNMCKNILHNYSKSRILNDVLFSLWISYRMTPIYIHYHHANTIGLFIL
jgi:hypothetical protein